MDVGLDVFVELLPGRNLWNSNAGLRFWRIGCEDEMGRNSVKGWVQNAPQPGRWTPEHAAFNWDGGIWQLGD